MAKSIDLETSNPPNPAVDPNPASTLMKEPNGYCKRLLKISTMVLSSPIHKIKCYTLTHGLLN